MFMFVLCSSALFGVTANEKSSKDQKTSYESSIIKDQKIKGSRIVVFLDSSLKMNSCFCVLLVWCLTILKLFHLGSSNPNSNHITKRHTGGQSYGSEENVFLSRLLNNPNLQAPADKCEEQQSPVCDPSSPYRTYDGTCNNLQNPTWGSVTDCLVRILPAFYEGESGMRRAIDGDPLPTPRELSLNIFPNKDRPEPEVTFLFTTFGQTVAHDQSLSTLPAGGDLTRDGINCCPVSSAENPECAGIVLEPDDPFYSKFNMTCLNFIRGIVCSSCEDTGKRDIANVVTSAIDTHLNYGVNQSSADVLRTKKGGKLKVRYSRSGELLLENTNPTMAFCPTMETSSCFVTGDLRVNQHTNLAALHTTFVREHNRLAHNLEIINPHWDDERLYQTARKILGAKIQAIVYNQYLPILLGREYMDKFELTVQDGGEGTQYNPNLRFGTWVEYTTAIFRAHSMVPTKTGYKGKKFRELYSNMHPILNGNMQQVIQGSCVVPSQQYDHFYVPDVTDFALQQPDENFGLDLLAIDIQRGRDHGVPTYHQVLNYCSSGDNITEFDQLSEVMSQKHIELLRKNYNSLQDVDLYVGMLMENIMEDSVLTTTAACIAAGQFYFTKFGDRFYFEHANEVPSFTAAQRKSLKRSSIARMICDNNNIKYMQKNPFLDISYTNPNLPCNKHRDVDLRLWKSYE